LSIGADLENPLLEPDGSPQHQVPLSIVIPCHNAAEQLEECLTALRKNDLQDVEILIVDDASTDHSARIAQELLKGPSGPRISYCRLEQQSGPAAARNYGASQVSNAYVLFLDSDILLPCRAIEWIRDTLDLYSHRSDVVGVLGCYSETIPWRDFFSRYKNLGVTFLYRETDTLSPYLHTPIFCVKLEVLNSVGGFDSTVNTAEDFHLGTVLGSQGYRFVIDRRILGVHLKKYSFLKILKEDWRRIQDLRAVRFSRNQRKFALQAHRFHRLLSLALPGPVLVGLVSAPWSSAAGQAALLLACLFYLCHLRFLTYCGRYEGIFFSLQSAAFIFLEILWVQVALARSLLPRR